MSAGHVLANIAQSQTDAALVTAVPGKSIRVKSLATMAGATATTLVFNSQTGAGAGAAISATFPQAIKTLNNFGYNPDGWFQTLPGDNLTCTTGAGSTSAIQLTYDLV